MYRFVTKYTFPLVAIICISLASYAQTFDPLKTSGPASILASDEIATAHRIAKEGERWYGDLFVTVDGKERKIADTAGMAWIIDGGREVAYSSSGGAGGFEGEGQTLHIYSLKTQETREVLSQNYMIDEVKDARLSTGAVALLVSMSDGAAGNPYFAVVDPKRGEVIFQKFGKLSRIEGDKIILNIYRDVDWDKVYPPEDEPDPRPKSPKTISLTKVLKNTIICNKPDERSGRRTHVEKCFKFSYWYFHTQTYCICNSSRGGNRLWPDRDRRAKRS